MTLFSRQNRMLPVYSKSTSRGLYPAILKEIGVAVFNMGVGKLPPGIDQSESIHSSSYVFITNHIAELPSRMNEQQKDEQRS